MSASVKLLIADVGKTRLRLQALGADGAILAEHTGAGIAGAASTAPDDVVRLLIEARERLGRLDGDASATWSVGVAGTLAAPERGAAIARGLAAVTGGEVAVTSDLIAAHLGAFRGGVGTVLIAGTGAVALGLHATGELRQSDGWGPVLGDLGSGAWIGREGIRAVLAHRDGSGPDAGWLDQALDELTGQTSPIAWVHADANPAGRCGRFAPAVVEAAAQGEPLAAEIIAAAVDHLARAAAHASAHLDRPAPVAVLGGVSSHPWFAAELERALRANGLKPAAPESTALAGAALLAKRRDLAHERHTQRA